MKKLGAGLTYASMLVSKRAKRISQRKEEFEEVEHYHSLRWIEGYETALEDVQNDLQEGIDNVMRAG